MDGGGSSFVAKLQIIILNRLQTHCGHHHLFIVGFITFQTLSARFNTEPRDGAKQTGH